MTTTLDGLRVALSAEEAAVWAYPLVGAKVSTGYQSVVAKAHGVHQMRVAELSGRLAALRADVPDPAAAYSLPFPVTDSASAIKLAVHLEDGVSAGWRYLVAAAETAELRRYAVAQLTACALQSMRWRGRAHLTLTQAFPGT